ncbi:MAG: 2-hydroxyacyl-CoA dehydratase [Lachnospiraceae bacterium]|nr:2-hydroxyacyl-CoA dehydratase [Lachnospiraceae bacterium]
MMDQNERRRERFQSKSAYIASKYLRKMEELSGRPEALTPFIDVLKKANVDFERILPTDKKVVGTYCMMVPQELIYAAGAENVKLCSGSFTGFSIGEDITPRDACPLVKAVAGMQEVGKITPYSECDLMVVPVTCDCKKKIASMLAETTRVHVMQVPSVRQSDELLELYVEELYRCIPVLEEVTGNRITFNSLLDGVEAVGLAQKEMTRFMKLRRNHKSMLLRGTHTMAVMNALSLMPIADWTEALKKLNDELEERVRTEFAITRKKLPRLLLTGSPVVFPNMKLPLLMEETGGALVADETCMGERFLYDPLAVCDQSFDGYMRAMATRSIRPCTCPTFWDSSTRLFRLKQMIKDNQVDGIVYHVLRGCLVYDFEYQLIEEEMGKLDIPIIRVETDYNEEDIEQLRIRIEAFVELIKLKGEGLHV